MTHGLTAAMLVLLGASAPVHAPDLQVEAATATGVALPELADSVARALVAGGARVVLRGPSSGPCEYCAQVKVTETGPGTCQVEVRQANHAAATTLHLPADSVLFDRARAIAIQAHLLVTWKSKPEKPEAKQVASRLRRRADADVEEPLRSAEPPPVLASSARTLSPARTVDSPPTQSALPPPALPGTAADAPIPPPVVVYTSRGEVRPESRTSDVGATARPDTKPVDRAGAEPAKRVAARADVSRPPESRVVSAADVTAGRAGVPKPRWPWIPTAVGAAVGVAAGVCALVARNRYDGLSDKTQPYGRAQSLKSSGESWQLASLILSGVAAAGLGVGIVGFATRSSSGPTLTVAATPVPSGGMVAIAGGLP